MTAPLTAERLAEIRAGAERGHRMSCSDPDDPTRQTPYSVQLDLLAEVERLTERAERAEGALAQVEAVADVWVNRYDNYPGPGLVLTTLRFAADALREAMEGKP